MTLSALRFGTDVSPLVQARDERRLLAAVLQGIAGKLGGGDGFLVNPNTGKNVRIEPCASPLEHLVINGTENALQGAYAAFLDAVDTSITLDPEPGSNSRIDVVLVHIEDAEYSGSNYQPLFDFVTGTAGPSPAVPDPAAAGFENFHVLAEVLRTSSEAATIPGSAFTDVRGQTFAGSRAWIGALTGDGVASSLSIDLPTGQFEHFELRGGLSASSGGPHQFNLRMNNDSGSNYSIMRIAWSGGDNTPTTVQSRTATGLFAQLSGSRGPIRADIMDASRDNVGVTLNVRGRATSTDSNNRWNEHQSVYEGGPATSLQLETDDVFASDTRVDVYGIRRGLGAAQGE